MGQSNTNSRPYTLCLHLYTSVLSFRCSHLVFIAGVDNTNISLRAGYWLPCWRHSDICSPHLTPAPLSSAGLWLVSDAPVLASDWLRWRRHVSDSDVGIWVFTLLGGGISHTHLLGTLSPITITICFKLINNINSHTGTRRGILPVDDPFPAIEEKMMIERALYFLHRSQFSVRGLHHGADLAPPAADEAGPHGDRQLVRLTQLCLDQPNLLGQASQRLVHVTLLHGRHVVHLHLHQLVCNLDKDF